MENDDISYTLGQVEANLQNIQTHLNSILSTLSRMEAKFNDFERRITTLEISSVRHKETKKFVLNNWKTLLAGAIAVVGYYIKSIVSK
jgi:prefoldin subunit 5